MLEQVVTHKVSCGSNRVRAKSKFTEFKPRCSSSESIFFYPKNSAREVLPTDITVSNSLRY